MGLMILARKYGPLYPVAFERIWHLPVQFFHILCVLRNLSTFAVVTTARCRSDTQECQVLS